jgi:CheY-like chemotaxis protein
MKVLIVQDFPAIGRLEAQALRDLGHQVTWVTGFKDLENLEGYNPDKSTLMVGSDFDLAIVDGQIHGPTGKVEELGLKVVSQLVRSGIKFVVANSSQDDLNAEMVEAGAHSAINQHVLFICMCVAKLITAEDILTPSAEAAGLFAMGLATFSRGPGQSYLDATDALLMAD